MIVEHLYDSTDIPVNEERYYMNQSGLNFNRTSGSKDKKVKGLIKAAPILILSTLVSWPLTLLGVIGALSYRWQKRWEDRDAKRHMFTPAYWSDYLANSHTKDDKEFSQKSTGDKVSSVWGIGGKNKDTSTGTSQNTSTQSTSNQNNKDTDSSTDSSTDTSTNRGLLAHKITPEEQKSQDFKVYWVKMSNGEIVRVRALDEKGAKELCNNIIKETKETCYDVLNQKINYGYPKFIFYLDSGEIIHWSGKDKKTALTEALQTRKELCDVLNKEYPNLTKMEPLEAPKKAIKSEGKKGERIIVPELNKFDVTTTKPDFSKTNKKNKTVYEWGTLKQFKTHFFMFNSFYLPSENERDAEKIVRDFFEKNKNEISSIMKMMNVTTKMYKVTFADHDIYNVPGKTEVGAISLAKQLHDSKIDIINNNMTGVNRDDWEELVEDFNKMEYNVTLKSIKNVVDTPETYSPPKNPKKFKLVKRLDDKDSVEYGPYELW